MTNINPITKFGGDNTSFHNHSILNDNISCSGIIWTRDFKVAGSRITADAIREGKKPSSGVGTCVGVGFANKRTRIAIGVSAQQQVIMWSLEESAPSLYRCFFSPNVSSKRIKQIYSQNQITVVSLT